MLIIVGVGYGSCCKFTIYGAPMMCVLCWGMCAGAIFRVDVDGVVHGDGRNRGGILEV